MWLIRIISVLWSFVMIAQINGVFKKGNKSECPYYDIASFYEEAQRTVLVPNETYKLNISYDKERGYYLWQEPSNYYKMLYNVPQAIPGEFIVVDQICEDYDNGNYRNNSEPHLPCDLRIISTNEDFDFGCGYQNEDNLTTCTNYDEICAVDTTCYCQSKLLNHYCKESTCGANYASNECERCDSRFESYKHPSISLERITDNNQTTCGSIHVTVYNYLKLNRYHVYCFTDGFSKYRGLVGEDFEIFNRIQLNFTIENGTLFSTWPLLVTEPYCTTLGHYWCEAFDYQLQLITSNVIIFNNDLVRSSITVNITIGNDKMLVLQQDPFLLYDLQKVLHNKYLNIDSFQIEFLNVYPRKSNTYKLSYRVYAPKDVTEKEIIDALLDYNESNGCKFNIIEKTHEENFSPNTITYSATFCMDNRMRQDDGTFIDWPKTQLGQSATARQVCLDSNGSPMRRKCLGEKIYGVYWSKIDMCANQSSSKNTGKLKELASSELDPAKKLRSLDDIVQDMIESNKPKPIDIYLSAEIVKSTKNSTTSFNFTKFSCVINHLMEIDRGVLRESQISLNSTDSILESLKEVFLDQKADIVSIDNENLEIYSNYHEDINGIAVYEDHRLIPLKKINNVTEINRKKLKFAVFLPQKPKGIKFNLIAFKRNSLFNQIEEYSTEGVSLGIFQSLLNDKSVAVPLPATVLMRSSRKYRKKLKCSSWEYDKQKGQWKVDDFAESHEGIHICHPKTMSFFGLLVDDEDSFALTLITYIGCGLSFLGASGVVVTAVFYEVWREHPGTKLLLNFVSVSIMQNVVLVSSGGLNGYKHPEFCIGTGAFLHYLILAQFIWSVLFAYLQYQRYVNVFDTSYESKWIVLKFAVVAWGLPIIPPLIVLAINRLYYLQDNYCYLAGLPLILAVYLPIGLVIVINIAVFIAITKNLPKTHNSEFFWLNIRLMILMFFIFGFYWIFGFLAAVTHTIALAYIFCATASMQGLVIFLYFIVFNVMIRNFWVRMIRK